MDQEFSGVKANLPEALAPGNQSSPFPPQLRACEHSKEAMASTKSTADALYEKGQVSPSVSVDDSPIFFREHGVFYGTSPAIGRLVDGVKPGVDGLDDFKADLLKDAVS